MKFSSIAAVAGLALCAMAVPMPHKGGADLGTLADDGAPVSNNGEVEPGDKKRASKDSCVDALSAGVASETANGNVEPGDKKRASGSSCIDAISAGVASETANGNVEPGD